jgi:hypothetical protein
MASTVVPLFGQTNIFLSSKINYRQNRKGELKFRGGSFDVAIRDGSYSDESFCSFSTYQPPGRNAPGPCAPGTSGYIQNGQILNDFSVNRYLQLLETPNAAVAIQPLNPEPIQLVASPPTSKLPIPLAGFTDDSISIQANLHTPNVQDYIISRYNFSRGYNSKSENRLRGEIARGGYLYSVPRLNVPDLSITLPARIAPIAEGLRKLNGQTSGFEFIIPEGSRWTKQGFLEISSQSSPRFRWKGLTRDNTFLGADELRASIKEISNPNDSTSRNTDFSIYPAFETRRADDILLRNALQDEFRIPADLPAGTKGVFQLELKRSLNTTGVGVDTSNRKFQIPIIISDRYSDYRKNQFGKRTKRVKILEDFDNDGFNNLNEWIAGTSSTNPTNFPVLRPALVKQFSDSAIDIVSAQFFGFDVDQKIATTPKVSYELQRSVDNGVTWLPFGPGYYLKNGGFLPITDPIAPFFLDRLNADPEIIWVVREVEKFERGISTKTLEVRSNAFINEPDLFIFTGLRPIQPPNTASHLYRTKISRN